MNSRTRIALSAFVLWTAATLTWCGTTTALAHVVSLIDTPSPLGAGALVCGAVAAAMILGTIAGIFTHTARTRIRRQSA